MLGSVALAAFLGGLVFGLVCLAVCLLGVVVTALDLVLDFVAETLCGWGETCGAVREKACGRLWS